MISAVPEMSELYRRLLDQLTRTFGGVLDETNAEAIAYAAAELYHRDVEPRLWQEKSAHDVLDLFGVPRAGVLAPYSLSERLLIFQRRARGADYVRRAHELLTALGIPDHDRPLQWRLEQFLAKSEVAMATRPDADADPGPVVEDGPEDREETAADGAAEEAADQEVVVDTEAERDDVDGPGALEDEETVDHEDDDDPTAAEIEDSVEVEGGPAAVDTEAEEEAEVEVEAEEALAADEEEGEEREAVDAEEGEAFGVEDDHGLDVDEGEPSLELPGQLDVNVEPAAAPLVDAVRALEQAARVEAELSQVGLEDPSGVDLVRLSGTLNGMQAELVALRTLIEGLGDELRERLEALHEEVLVAQGVLGPEPGRNRLTGPHSVTTQDLPPVPDQVDAAPPGKGRSRRRVALVVLLVVLGLLIAGAVILIAVYGWDQIRSEVTGVMTLSTFGLWLPAPHDFRREEQFS